MQEQNFFYSWINWIDTHCTSRIEFGLGLKLLLCPNRIVEGEWVDSHSIQDLTFSWRDPTIPID